MKHSTTPHGSTYFSTTPLLGIPHCVTILHLPHFPDHSIYSPPRYAMPLHCTTLHSLSLYVFTAGIPYTEDEVTYIMSRSFETYITCSNTMVQVSEVSCTVHGVLIKAPHVFLYKCVHKHLPYFYTVRLLCLRLAVVDV